MTNLKHVGRVKNTGRRCIVVFREMYDEEGNVTDPNHCLIIESESLPDAEHNEIMRLVESVTMQDSPNAYEVFARARLSNGYSALAWMHASNRLQKMPTSNIELTPDTKTVIGLDQVNNIVRMQAEGASQDDIDNALSGKTDPVTTETSVTNSAQSQASSNDVLDDAAIAKARLDQAIMFETQAEELRNQAYELDPSLKPKRKTGRQTTKDAAANKKA